MISHDDILVVHMILQYGTYSTLIGSLLNLPSSTVMMMERESPSGSIMLQKVHTYVEWYHAY